MLTIHHYAKGGHESIDTAESVSFFPAIYPPVAVGSTSDDPPTRKAQLTAFGCKTSGENHSTFSDGIVYVMNDAGKTIAKYDLNRDPPILAATT